MTGKVGGNKRLHFFARLAQYKDYVTCDMIKLTCIQQEMWDSINHPTSQDVEESPGLGI